MFKTIVVGVDGRDGDADAIALAQRLADPRATLILTGVVDSGGAGARGTNADFDRVMRDEMQVTAQRLRDALTDGSAKTETVVAGTVAHGLLVAARRHDADLVVVGSCRRGGLGRLLVGDDARAMVRDADRPVALAPVGFAKRRTAFALIGAGYDGDDTAQNALETARELAQTVGARVRAINVVTAGHWPLDPMGMDVSVAIENDRIRAEEAVRQAAAATGDVESRVEVGLSHQVLLEFARQVDLLVVGAHHRGRLGRWFYGSTSEALSHDLSCPLLVVPADAITTTDTTEPDAAHASSSSPRSSA